MKKLPIGISTFSEIIESDAYYVDKSRYVRQLFDSGKYFFLSRPRRFGKSLFVDTLKSAFEGQRELFKGLYLDNHWKWEDTYPVISISFGGGRFSDIQHLNDSIEEILSANAHHVGVELTGLTINGRFRNLITSISQKFGKKVVILVDEYDKPILDHIENPSHAETLRDGLKNFYSVIKDNDRYLRFCFITGVSKFSKVSIFSDLNNLRDISLDPRFGAICGYTQHELEEIFADLLAGVDLLAMKNWYNGYHFLGKEKVYNPFDVLLFFESEQYGNYWFESATPSFLIKLLHQKKVYIPDLSHIEIDQGLLSGFDLSNLLPEAVLFQSGYLTIQSVETLAPGQRIFTLDYPNKEVQVSFNMHLLNYFTAEASKTSSLRLRMSKALKTKDMNQMEELFKSLFSSIPFEWYTAGKMDHYEGYYASVVYAFLASLGFDLHPEPSTSHGRADLILKTDASVYIFEFKVVEIVGDGKKAIHQIREKGYHDQYVQAGADVMLVGMDFSKKERNLVGFDHSGA